MEISRQKIVEGARSWIGTPYHHQASVKGAGTDCLGLLRGVYRELYGMEPERAPNYSADWAEATGEETLLGAAQRHLQEIDLQQIDVGDVVLFRMLGHGPAKHCGIISTNTHFIHAWSGRQVAQVPLSQAWRRRLVFAFCFPGVV